jgi:hypothetical protein
MRKRKIIQARWHRKNLDKVRNKRRENYHRKKDACYAAYGGYVCVCCGITEPLFLTLDHIHNDGAKFRANPKFRGRGSRYLYKWIIKNNFPDDMFQVLCYNCNCGRARNNNICPHKKGGPMAKGSGDKLASGAIKAQFPNAGANVSQKRWDEIFGSDSGPNRKAVPRKRRKS